MKIHTRYLLRQAYVLVVDDVLKHPNLSVSGFLSCHGSLLSFQPIVILTARVSKWPRLHACSCQLASLVE